MRLMRRPLWTLLASASLCVAAVTQIHVGERTDFAGGKSWGPAGAYERITAKANFAIDPENAANKIITDLSLAPVNADGLVEFSADIIVLKPRDSKLANGTILFEVPNRGGQGALGMFNLGGGSTNAGDGYLMEQGYTIIWCGWQPDIPRANAQGLRLYAPQAKGVEGLVRSEVIVDVRTNRAPLGDRNHVPYPVLNPADPKLELTVRDGGLGRKTVVPRKSWRVDGDDLVLDSGFEPGRVYELVYPSKDPWLIGLGPTAVRDLISFFKYGGPSMLFNDEHRYMKRAIGFGTSQSGRFLRAFLYWGFNADEKGKMVFDGVWPHVAGGGRGSFNNRFGQPSRDGHPLLNFFYPTDLYPYTDLPEPDGDGHNAGLLDRAIAAKVAPKIFTTNGSYEYWGRAASLIHTTPDGKKDAPLATDSRIYFLAGTQHGANAKAARNHTANLANPMDYRWSMRGLLADLNAWITNGTEPPPSQYPRIDKDQLVAIPAMQFPKVPGVVTPKVPHKAYRVDYGPEFESKGIVANEPPKVGREFPVLIPQVDRDGNETSGVRSAEQMVPLGSYTGWNLRDAKVGAPELLFNMVGSFVPFAKTRAERERKGDPRLSIEERYPAKADYLARVETAARQLVASRLLLERDIEGVKQQASQRWDWVMSQE